MDSRYQRQYQDLHSRHWWWRARSSAFARLVARSLGAPIHTKTPLRILEIGSGSGLNFSILRPYGSVTGVEIDERWRDFAPAGPEQIWFGDFLSYPANDASFDVIVALDVIEHIENDQAAVEKMRRLLVPGGLALINVPAWNFLWTRHDDLNQHYRRYSPNQFTQLFLKKGFQLREVRSLFLWTIFGKLAVRVFESLRRQAPLSDEDIPRVPPRFLNEILNQGSRIENVLLRWLPLGLGTSLMAAFQKPSEKQKS